MWGNGAFSSGGNCERPAGYNSIFSGSDLEGVKGAIASSSQRLEGVMGVGGTNVTFTSVIDQVRSMAYGTGRM